jgi:hypothetical protein
VDTRVIFENDTTITDFTVGCNDYFNNNANAFGYVVTDDFLYLGSRFPFNELYFKFGTANTATETLSIAIWDGTQFSAAIEVNDGTETGGASFAQDGYISWVPDKSKGWARDDTVDSSGTENIPNFGTTTIYDHYWVRFAFSGSLDAGTTLAWIGPLFSNDDDLGIEFPDLVRTVTMNGWDDTGSKSNWQEQHVFAAKEIIKELKERRTIVHQSQILFKKDWTAAAVAKVAEIAFRGMGKDFEEDRMDATKLFASRINRSIGLIDRDKDAQIDRHEIEHVQGKLTRGALISGERGFN